MSNSLVKLKEAQGHLKKALELYLAISKENTDFGVVNSSGKYATKIQEILECIHQVDLEAWIKWAMKKEKEGNYENPVRRVTLKSTKKG